MKTFLLFFSLSSLIICSMTGFCNEVSDTQTGDEPTSGEVKSLQLVSSPELSELTLNWVADFGKTKPDLKIAFSQIDDGAAIEPETLYFLDTDQQAMDQNELAWKMVIAHDVIVPIINSKNPLLKEIYRIGITAEDLGKVLSEDSGWSLVVDGAPEKPINCFMLDNQQVASTITNYTKAEVPAFQTTTIVSAQDLISSVQRDPYAIGFCKLVDVLQPETNAFTDQISILPVDKNRNGRLDSFENMYDSPDQLTRGAWIGKYPRSLSGNIYALATSEPSNQTALDFLVWLNKNGQNYLNNSGYSTLSGREKTENLLALVKPVAQPTLADAPLIPLGWKLAIGAMILLLLIVLIRSRRKQQNGILSEDIATTNSLNEKSIHAPAGLYYGKSHTWAYMEPDGMVIVGIDDFMQHLTGSLTQVIMRESGEKIRKGEKIITLVREGKQLDLYSPVSGVIKLQNQRLHDHPAGINAAPYTDGWTYLIEPANWHRETRFLLVAEKYKEWLEDEFNRLKDFLANSANANDKVFNQLIMQDGGELTDHVLANLSPEVWQDFQTEFIDHAR